MATKWVPAKLTEDAIVRLEGQMLDSQLVEYGTPEHLAVIRYGVEACCSVRKTKVAKLGKDGKPELANGAPVMIDGEEFVLDRAKLRDWFAAEAAFLGYASNAKKMLIENGTLDAKAKAPTRGYE